MVRLEQIKEQKIREAVDNRIKEFAKNLETRYIKELHDSNGVINSKKKNVFIKPLGNEFIFNFTSLSIDDAGQNFALQMNSPTNKDVILIDQPR